MFLQRKWQLFICLFWKLERFEAWLHVPAGPQATAFHDMKVMWERGAGARLPLLACAFIFWLFLPSNRRGGCHCVTRAHPRLVEVCWLFRHISVKTNETECNCDIQILQAWPARVPFSFSSFYDWTCNVVSAVKMLKPIQLCRHN